MKDVTYCSNDKIDAGELSEFYTQVNPELAKSRETINRFLNGGGVCVCAKMGGRLIGVARGFCDGLRGYFTECKLLTEFQGPGAVSRKNGRIEHDTSGIAAEMGRRIIDALREQGAQRVDVMAWGTEVDFLEELGFRRRGGLVGMTLTVDGEVSGMYPRAAATAQ